MLDSTLYALNANADRRVNFLAEYFPHIPVRDYQRHINNALSISINNLDIAIDMLKHKDTEIYLCLAITNREALEILNVRSVLSGFNDISYDEWYKKDMKQRNQERLRRVLLLKQFVQRCS